MKKFLQKLRSNGFLSKMEYRLKRWKGEGMRAVLFELGQFFLLAGIFIAVIVVFWQSAERLQGTIFERRKLVQALEQRIQSEKDLRKDFGRVREILPVLPTFLPDEDGLPLFLSRVDALADSLGTAVTTDLGGRAQGDLSVVLPLTFRMNVALDPLIVLFQSLEKMQYIVQVQSFEITAPESIQRSGQVKINAGLFMRP